MSTDTTVITHRPQGFIPDIITPDQYMFGGVNMFGEVLRPDGQWDRYLPTSESQINGFDTMACTSFGTLNVLETLMEAKYDRKENFSDRYSAIVTGTTRQGNSPHHVIEVIRKYAGVVPENTLGFDRTIDTWDEYYTGLIWGHRMLGVRWLLKWEVNHDWVFAPNENPESKQDALMDALKFSPVGVAVQAWSKRDGLYVKTGPSNHWVMLYGYKKGAYWEIFDHVDNAKKRLAWDYDFDYAKRYDIRPRTEFPITFYTRIAQGLLGAYV